MDRYVVTLYINPSPAGTETGQVAAHIRDQALELRDLADRLQHWPIQNARQALWRNGPWPIFGGVSGLDEVGTIEYIVGPEVEVPDRRLHDLSIALRKRSLGHPIEEPATEGETAAIAAELKYLRDMLRQVRSAVRLPPLEDKREVVTSAEFAEILDDEMTNDADAGGDSATRREHCTRSMLRMYRVVDPEVADVEPAGA